MEKFKYLSYPNYQQVLNQAAHQAYPPWAGGGAPPFYPGAMPP